MRDLCLKEDLKLSKTTGENEYCIALINKFMPLINKYSNNSSIEDLKESLICKLLEVAKITDFTSNRFKEDKQIIYYISKTLKHEYIRLSKKFSYINSNTYNYEFSIENSPIDSSDFQNIELNLFLNNIFEELTEPEKFVLINKYIKNKSVTDISKTLNKSRQTIHKYDVLLKSKLRKYYY